MADHSGHRKHLRERFVNEGLTNFPEHTALELLLTYILMNGLCGWLLHKFRRVILWYGLTNS